MPSQPQSIQDKPDTPPDSPALDGYQVIPLQHHPIPARGSLNYQHTNSTMRPVRATAHIILTPRLLGVGLWKSRLVPVTQGSRVERAHSPPRPGRIVPDTPDQHSARAEAQAEVSGTTLIVQHGDNLSGRLACGGAITVMYTITRPKIKSQTPYFS